MISGTLIPAACFAGAPATVYHCYEMVYGVNVFVFP